MVQPGSINPSSRYLPPIPSCFFSITLRKPTATPRTKKNRSTHTLLTSLQERHRLASPRRPIGFLHNCLTRSCSPDARRRPRRQNSGPSTLQSSFPASHSPDAGHRHDPPLHHSSFPASHSPDVGHRHDPPLRHLAPPSRPDASAKATQSQPAHLTLVIDLIGFCKQSEASMSCFLPEWWQIEPNSTCRVQFK
ncbi:uncharacterized protein LOC123408206 [Hordeum vulgare subsp. vulgare]|uniref:uncharacterized protein LOC123408206 n=1 Tax=Hordeum vulgare subsp. vulgare TaxID=112509 RepID=UPI001D1A56CA|nr:uncharacterized protein LOC123408206 [Hordeum vulgare subsp. vulgare]